MKTLYCYSIHTGDSSQDQLCGYKIVGDNIDKNVHPRFQTLSVQAKSLHYFHCYAVKDRIPSLSLSDIPPTIPSEINIHHILPSVECNGNLIEMFKILVMRYVCMMKNTLHVDGNYCYKVTLILRTCSEF